MQDNKEHCFLLQWLSLLFDLEIKQSLVFPTEI